MLLKYVTFTGVDKSTDLDKLIELGEMYPWIEWAILLGTPGKYKYPPLSWVEYAIQKLSAKVNVSLHIDAAYVPATINFNPLLLSLLKMLTDNKGKTRLQLNFDALDNTVNLLQLQWFIRHMDIPVITQINHNNKYVNKILQSTVNTQYLYDASNGNGVPIKEFSKPVPDYFKGNTLANLTGYAGGINKDNLFTVLGNIGSVTELNQPVWIDIQSGVKGSGGTFSVAECNEIIEKLNNTTYVSPINV